MPAIESREIGIALDMHGCPNRCRHCYLGCASRKQMTHDDLRWASERFRNYVRPGEAKPFVEKLNVLAWVREPDYSDDYRKLHELAAELSDGPPQRFELLSIWRLAHDTEYAKWAKQVGPDTCQISFFGMEETTDWFCRRKGAFRDCISATERLLDAGMKPRWQLFLTKKILPDLDDLMRLVERMRLRERVEELGGEFTMFMHPPGFEGEGRKIAHLAATIDDTKLIPGELVAATRKHTGREKLWPTEAEVIAGLVSGERPPSPMYGSPDRWYFFVTPRWDVFSNIANLEPWWRLGNLKTDGIETVLDRFENDRPLGYRVNSTISARELAERYGNPDSKVVLAGPDERWLAEYCEEGWKQIAGK